MRSPLAYVVFVCSGNICRSPMAQALLAEAARDQGVDLEVISAGIDAYEGMPVSPLTVEVLGPIGERLRHHHAQRLNVPMLEDADLVVTMTSEHAATVVELYPEFAEKVIAFADIPGGRDIEDPYLGTIGAYQATRTALEAGLPGLLETLTVRARS